MPRQIMSLRVPVSLSIFEFDVDEGHNIFLTYTHERQRGPGISRTGKGPPFMERIGGQPGETTTHPFGLRLGTWLLQADMRQAELNSAQAELEKARQANAPQEDIAVLKDTVKELDTIQAHDTIFHECYPDHKIIGQQGCGDLTMNLWNVAYVNNALGKNSPEFVYWHEEEKHMPYRTYSCLVKWKPTQAGVNRFTIEDVRFSPNPGDDSNKMVWVHYRDQWLPRGKAVDFAVSSQQVIRNGQIVPAYTINHQFSDFRHLIRMPNLNPKAVFCPISVWRHLVWRGGLFGRRKLAAGGLGRSCVSQLSPWRQRATDEKCLATVQLQRGINHTATTDPW